MKRSWLVVFASVWALSAQAELVELGTISPGGAVEFNGVFGPGAYGDTYRFTVGPNGGVKFVVQAADRWRTYAFEDAVAGFQASLDGVVTGGTTRTFATGGSEDYYVDWIDNSNDDGEPWPILAPGVHELVVSGRFTGVGKTDYWGVLVAAAPVPEAATFAQWGVGMLTLLLVRRRARGRHA